jgi:magnesium chelatase family protein
MIKTPYSGSACVVEAQARERGAAWQVIGLPDAVVREASARIIAALSGVWPKGRGVLVSISPAALRKRGESFDLPMALAALCAMGRLQAPPHDWAAGGVSISGRLVPVPNPVETAQTAKAHGATSLLLPQESALQAAFVDGIAVYGAATLAEALEGGRRVSSPDVVDSPAQTPAGDFADVVGQAAVKWALALAVGGGHHVLMTGDAGAGKTMMASRLPTIMPALTRDEVAELTALYQSAGDWRPAAGGLIVARPFRAPHHTCAPEALLGGGGGVPRPGEVSLAHLGVLFLDEFGEFRRDCLEGLRQALESRRVFISRSEAKASFPCDFMLVAAQNPCPCGRVPCICKAAAVEAYEARISGPVADRVDVQAYVQRPDAASLFEREADGLSSAALREVVERIRKASARRKKLNAALARDELMGMLRLSERERAVVAANAERLRLSERGIDKILRVARSVADAGGSAEVEYRHVVQAFPLRAQGKRMVEESQAVADAVDAALGADAPF